MQVQLRGSVGRLRARVEPDEPWCDLAIVDGRPALFGECDYSNAATIDAWLATFGRAAIDVDLRGVTFFDATALRTLLVAAQRNPNMRVVAPAPAVERVLDLTDTRDILVYGTSLYEHRRGANQIDPDEGTT
jgi:anti-anti-sigma factor